MIGPMIAALLLQAAVPAPAGQWFMPTPANDERTWVIADDYPSLAYSSGAGGITSTRLTVSPEGRVIRCEITSSSGNADLDAAACTALSARAMFNPARDRSGQPVEGIYAKRVRWVPPANAIAANGPPISFDARHQATLGTIIRLRLNSQGLVDQCLVSTLQGAPAPLDSNRQEVCREAGRIALLNRPTAMGRQSWFEIRTQGLNYDSAPMWAQLLSPVVPAPPTEEPPDSP